MKNKNVYLGGSVIISLLLLWGSQLYSQNVGINNSGNLPDNSAMLDIESTTRGLLIPRMTTSQRVNIQNPAEGLMVYDTDTDCFWYHDGNNWTDLASGVANTSLWTENINSAIYSNVAVGISTTDPKHNLQVNGDVLLGTGNYLLNATDPEVGMYFDDSRKALRVGEANGFYLGLPDYWLSTDLGLNSFSSGESNAAFATNSAIAGGLANEIINISQESFIGGGSRNQISGQDYNGIVGGYQNTIAGGGSNSGYSFIGAGRGHINNGQYSAIVGGQNDSIYANHQYGFIGGGEGNSIQADWGHIGGGLRNRVKKNYGGIISGISNEVLGVAGVIAGGDQNQIGQLGSKGFIGAGQFNEINADGSGSVGGTGLRVNQGASYAFLGGGQSNSSSAYASAIIGGSFHQIPNSGQQAIILGGQQNQASGTNDAVIGGSTNTASGGWSAVIGGVNNNANGTYSAIGGGSGNNTTGNYSFAAGIGNNPGSYGEISLGSYPYQFNYPANSEFLIYATNPVFTVGNGSSPTNRSNALTILQNGRVAVNAIDPGPYGFMLYQGSSRGLGIEDVAGQATWAFEVSSNNPNNLALTKNLGLMGGFNGITGAYGQASDARLKTGVKNLESMLAKVDQLRPVRYQFIRDENKAEWIGFIAQEVVPHFPELVNSPTNDGEYFSLDYSGFSIIAIKAIQEQQAIIENQNKRIDQLMQEMQELKDLIRQQKQD